MNTTLLTQLEDHVDKTFHKFPKMPGVNWTRDNKKMKIKYLLDYAAMVCLTRSDMRMDMDNIGHNSPAICLSDDFQKWGNDIRKSVKSSFDEKISELKKRVKEEEKSAARFSSKAHDLKKFYQKRVLMRVSQLKAVRDLLLMEFPK